MEKTIIYIFCALFIGLGLGVFMYFRSFKAIVSYSNKNNVHVFGKKYRNVFCLVSDFKFMASLSNYENLQKCSDDTLNSLFLNSLKTTKTMLRACMFFALLSVAISALLLLS